MVVFLHGHREVRALAPLGEPLVERVADGLDLVAQRLEDGPQEPLAAPHRQHVDPGRERDRRRRQLGPVLAAALEGRAEDLGDRHAQERRGGVGPVVDVLGQQEALVGVLAPDHAHRVHVEQQAGRAALGADLGVVDVGLAEAQVERLEPVRVLVQQVAQVGCRSVGRRDRQQHPWELREHDVPTFRLLQMTPLGWAGFMSLAAPSIVSSAHRRRRSSAQCRRHLGREIAATFIFSVLPTPIGIPKGVPHFLFLSCDKALAW